MEESIRNVSDSTSRREFVLKVCQAGSIAALGAILLEACNQNPLGGDVPSLATVQASVSNGVVSLNVGGGSPLAGVGTAALVQFSGGALLVAHTAQSAFTALSSFCTHQNCQITGWQNQTYVCTCHGSKFSTSGQVTQGPARTALKSYATQVSNSTLMITL